jgi:hypothetical protein
LRKEKKAGMSDAVDGSPRVVRSKRLSGASKSGTRRGRRFFTG